LPQSQEIVYMMQSMVTRKIKRSSTWDVPSQSLRHISNQPSKRV